MHLSEIDSSMDYLSVATSYVDGEYKAKVDKNAQ